LSHRGDRALLLRSARLCLHEKYGLPYDPLRLDVCGLLGSGESGPPLSNLSHRWQLEITMKTLILAAIRCSLIFLIPTATYAISAQWDLDPISRDWNVVANWTPKGVSNSPADTATFGLSNTTDVSTSANTEIDSIIFTSAATNPYTITISGSLTLTISGVGITNNSGIAQNFITNGVVGRLVFTNNATAGNYVVVTNNGGITSFHDTSTVRGARYQQC
jgi:hypothetical protein